MAIWFQAVNTVMESSEKGMFILHQRSVADYAKYVIDSTCVSAVDTSVNMEFPQYETIELEGDKIKVGNQVRITRCNVGVGTVKGGIINVQKVGLDRVKLQVV